MRESRSKAEIAEGAEVTCAPMGLSANQLTELAIGAAQVELPAAYKGIELNCGLRMDLVVEDTVVLELKVNHFPEPGATPVTSAFSTFSGFDFLNSLCLCVPAVNVLSVTI